MRFTDALLFVGAAAVRSGYGDWDIEDYDNTNGCWTDDWCCTFLDCCEYIYHCAGDAGDCYFDDECVGFGDCCIGDATNVYYNESKIYDYYYGCYIDDLCCYYNDCCEELFAWCD